MELETVFVKFLKSHKILASFKEKLYETTACTISEYIKVCEQNGVRLIKGAFVWRDSPEGSNYWRGLSEEWEKASLPLTKSWTFNSKYIWGYIDTWVIWVRVAPSGRGIIIKRTPPLFSERNGYQKYLRLPFGWRAQILEPTKHLWR